MIQPSGKLPLRKSYVNTVRLPVAGMTHRGRRTFHKIPSLRAGGIPIHTYATTGTKRKGPGRRDAFAVQLDSLEFSAKAKNHGLVAPLNVEPGEFARLGPCQQRLVREVLPEKKSVEEIRRAWVNELTDPKRHDPNNYCYLVHGIMFPDPNQVSVKAPEALHELPKLSASVITQDKADTFGAFGLILDVPTDNLVACHHNDFGSKRFRRRTKEEQRELLELYARIFPLRSPRHLIEHSDPTQNNEVIVVGMSDNGAKLRVAGVFAVFDRNGNPSAGLDPELPTQIAQKLGVPLVRIIATAATH